MAGGRLPVPGRLLTKLIPDMPISRALVSSDEPLKMMRTRGEQRRWTKTNICRNS